MNKRVISIVTVMLFAISLFSMTAFAADQRIELDIDSSVYAGRSYTIEGTAEGGISAVTILIGTDNKVSFVEQVPVSDGEFSRTITIPKSWLLDEAEGTTYKVVVSNIAGDVSASGQFKVTKRIGSAGGATGIGGGSGSKPSPSPSPSTDPSVSPEPSDELADYEWAREAIDALTSAGVIEGYPDGTFRPGNNVTRAEFTKLIVEALDIEQGETTLTFTDVPEDEWYVAHMDIATSKGIILGYEDGTFRPDNPITREELCTIIVRAAKAVGAEMPVAMPAFADSAEISDWAAESVASLAQLGIVNGIGDNVFAPKANANRAEAAKIIYGVMKHVGADLTPVDDAEANTDNMEADAE